MLFLLQGVLTIQSTLVEHLLHFGHDPLFQPDQPVRQIPGLLYLLIQLLSILLLELSTPPHSFKQLIYLTSYLPECLCLLFGLFHLFGNLPQLHIHCGH